MRPFHAFLSAVVVVTAVAAPAWGASPGMPYRGRLEQNGAPVTGTRTMSFRFFNAQTGSTAYGAASTQSVNVTGGEFSVIIPVPAAALAGTATGVWLEMTVDGVVIGGRQQILPGMFAMGTAQGDDFVVSGNLGVRNNAPGAAVTLGTGADVLGVDPTDEVLPQNTLEIRLGDESAGAVVMLDAQSAGQRGELVYKSGARMLELRNETSALTLDRLGNVTTPPTATVTTGTVNGRVVSPDQALGACPTGMSRLGYWCMDTTFRGPATLTASMNDCHDRFAALCPLSAYAMCDQLNFMSSTAGSCGQVTDGSAGRVLRTGESHAPEGNYGEEVFNLWTCYNNTDNSVDLSGCATSDSVAYFCCRPANF